MNNNNSTLHISIVIYKNKFSDLELLLEHLVKTPHVITIIDNSPDNDIEESLKRYNSVKYIFNNSNLGYGKGNNIAINQSIANNHTYHVVLNPDIEFRSDVLDELTLFMNAHPHVGLCMPNIVYPNLNRQYLTKLLPTPWNLFARRIRFLKRWNRKANKRYELRSTNFQTPFSAPSLSGAFMFMRTSVLIKTGGFDERFFMYCEDIDLSRRINQVSKTMFVPTNPVIHRYTKGSYKFNKMLFYHVRSAFQYFNKWGWFFDKERRKVNRDTLNKLNLL